MFDEICVCRLCGSSNLVDVLDLGMQHLTGIFPSDPTTPVPSGPVVLTKCEDETGCGLVQLRQTYASDIMYGDNYGYQSSLNSSMVKHLHEKVSKIQKLKLLRPGDIVLDIGCNDGTTLRQFNKDYIRVGIDPTAAKFSDRYPSDIIVIPEFFTKTRFEELELNKKAKVITSFSMFYDLPDPVGFARDVAECLEDEGIWVFEQSYLPLMLETNSFDTICQEHLEFYSLKQILNILDRVNLKCIDVEFNEVNGGSFSIVAAHKNCSILSEDKKIQEIVSSEIENEIHTTRVYQGFRDRIENLKMQTSNLLDDLIKDGNKIYGIGASTKGNVLLQYYGLGGKLEAIGEINSDKFGCFSPGTNIPIIEEDKVLMETDAYFLILPWHFRDFFIGSKKYKGKKLIFPLPKLEIVQT